MKKRRPRLNQPRQAEVVQRSVGKITFTMSQLPTSGGTYSVEFDRSYAWSLIYADGEGRLGFVFEPDEEKKRVYLNPHASIEDKMPDVDFYCSSRYRLALERTKQYLVSCGYEVLVDDPENERA